MIQFKKILNKSRLYLLFLIIFFFSASITIAQDKVVVIPLFGDETIGRSCEGTLSSRGRWCDNGDGTVKDMTTGLIWLKKTDWGGLRPWPFFVYPWSWTYESARERAAQLYAGAPDAGLNDGSIRGDWRLPTKSEFIKISRGDGVEAIKASTPYFFTGLQIYFYWSNTPLGFDDDRQAYYMHTKSGYVLYGSTYKTEYYVWPVR